MMLCAISHVSRVLGESKGKDSLRRCLEMENIVVGLSKHSIVIKVKLFFNYIIAFLLVTYCIFAK